MSEAVRNHLLIVLEQAAREELVGVHFEASAARDIAFVRYGAIAPRLVYMTGWTYDRVNYHLKALEKAGLVLKRRNASGTLRWWPVGLCAKIQKERAQ